MEHASESGKSGHDLNKRLSQILAESSTERAVARASRKGDINAEFKGLHIKHHTLTLFTRQMGTMLSAGVPLVRALRNMAHQPEAPRFGRMITAIEHDISSGYSISGALSRYPSVFSPLYISMAKVGEVQGQFGNAVSSIADFLEKDEKIKMRTGSALTYPFVICAVAALISWGLFNFLLPQFIRMFEEMHLDLPLITSVVVDIVYLAQNPLTVLAVAGLLIGGWHLWRNLNKTASGRYYCDDIKLSLPIFGGIFRRVATARLARALGTMVQGGVSMVKALELAGNACDNEVLRRRMLGAIENIKDGKKVSHSFDPQDGFFDPIVYHMIVVGEETGQVDTLLVKLADYYELEVDHVLEGVTAMLEPLLTFVIGLVVGVICLAIFLPLYGLVTQLGS